MVAMGMCSAVVLLGLFLRSDYRSGEYLVGCGHHSHLRSARLFSRALILLRGIAILEGDGLHLLPLFRPLMFASDVT